MTCCKQNKNIHEIAGQPALQNVALVESHLGILWKRAVLLVAGRIEHSGLKFVCNENVIVPDNLNRMRKCHQLRDGLPVRRVLFVRRNVEGNSARSY